MNKEHKRTLILGCIFGVTTFVTMKVLDKYWYGNK